MCTGGKGFDDIPGIFDSSISNDRDISFTEGFGNTVNGGYLRHSNTCHHSCGANRPWADAHLDCIHSCIDQSICSLGCGNVSTDDLQFREMTSQLADALEYSLRMTMSGIKHDQVHFRLNQGFRPLKQIFRNS